MKEEISPPFAPREKPALLEGMRLVQAKSQSEKVPKEVEILGKKFVIHPGVHSPAFNADTKFFASEIIPRIPPGSRFLEMGCGAGVISILAALNGADVTAVDISQASRECTAKNAERNGVSFPILASDVYSGLPRDAMYDIIFWNIPFGYVNKEAKDLSMLERAVFDPKHEGLREYILGAKQHLKKGGKLLLGYSSTLGDMDTVNAYAKQAGLQFFTLASMPDTNQFNHVNHFELLIAHNP